MAPPPTSRIQNIAVSILAVVILGFCCFGFGSKFIELVRLVSTDEVAATEGIFAIAPLSNYVLASGGFLMLLGWATAHGMFRNIELPKHTMLEIDEQLDDTTDASKFSDSVLR